MLHNPRVAICQPLEQLGEEWQTPSSTAQQELPQYTQEDETQYAAQQQQQQYYNVENTDADVAPSHHEVKDDDYAHNIKQGMKNVQITPVHSSYLA